LVDRELALTGTRKRVEAEALGEVGTESGSGVGPNQQSWAATSTLFWVDDLRISRATTAFTATSAWIELLWRCAVDLGGIAGAGARKGVKGEGRGLFVAWMVGNGVRSQLEGTTTGTCILVDDHLRATALLAHAFAGDWVKDVRRSAHNRTGFGVAGTGQLVEDLIGCAQRGRVDGCGARGISDQWAATLA
jgi:hypothetical protein